MKPPVLTAPLVLVCLLALVSTTVLLSLAAPAGLHYSWKDQQQYYSTARNLVQGRGFTFRHYEAVDDRVVDEPLTHFPPLASLLVAGLMTTGTPPHLAPTVYTLLTWLAFLAGTALLTRRLGGTDAAAAYAVAVSVVTWPYLSVFLNLSSEPLFLALVTWLAVSLCRVPRQGPITPRRWAAILIPMSLLPLSRYVGAFLLPAVVVWWLHARRGERWGRLTRETLLLCGAALPLAGWLARNLWRTSTLVGHGHGGSQHTFLDGLVGIVKHVTWLLLPTVRPGPVWRRFGWPAALVLLILGLTLAWAVWMGARRRVGRRPVHPVPAFLIAYLLIFTVLQPFMAFVPMSRRLVTVPLCLGLPWLFAIASAVPKALFHSLMAVYLTVNMLLLGLLAGWPAGQRSPLRAGLPFIEDLAGETGRVVELLSTGVPSWLLHPPPRIGDLQRHLPELASLLQTRPAHLAVISNAPDLFPDHPVERSRSPIEVWIEHGECETTTPAAVILVSWDRWAGDGPVLPYWDLPDPKVLRRRVEARCPDLTVDDVPHARVYFLPTYQAPLTPPASGTAPPPR